MNIDSYNITRLYNESKKQVATTPTWTPTQQKAINAILKRIKNGVIEGDVDLNNLELSRLPDLSKVKVTGWFYCSNNQLRTLEGSPQSVGGGFYCNNNQLRTLEGSPQSVGSDFSCDDNPLQTLEGSPQSVGGNFICRNNQLQTLEGSPQSVGGDFYCDNNPGNFPVDTDGRLDYEAYKKLEAEWKQNRKNIESKYGQDLEDI